MRYDIPYQAIAKCLRLSKQQTEAQQVIESTSNRAIQDAATAELESLQSQLRALHERYGEEALTEACIQELEEREQDDRMGLREDTPCLDLHAYHGPWHG